MSFILSGTRNGSCWHFWPGRDGWSGKFAGRPELRRGGKAMSNAGKLTRRRFGLMAAGVGLGARLFAFDRHGRAEVSPVAVDGAQSLRAHAETAGMYVGCAA